MLRSILVVLDESPDGSAAVELSLQWAQRHRASLLGLAVVDEPAVRRPEPLPIGGSYFRAHRNAVLLDDARGIVRRLMNEFTSRCAAVALPSTVVERTGRPHEQIAREAQRCDIVVMGRRTQFHFGAQAAADGTLMNLLKQSARPVIVVPSPGSGAGPVIIVCDGSARAARALYAFQATGLGSDGGVCLASVEGDDEGMAGADRAVDFLRSHAVNVRQEKVPVAAPRATPEAILQLARRLDARLLVMGSHAQAGLRGLLGGSLTEVVLERSHIPVFLFR